jgi:hypothetical protein
LLVHKENLHSRLKGEGKNNNNSSSTLLLLLGDTQDKEEILDSVVVLYINYYIPAGIVDENYWTQQHKNMKGAAEDVSLHTQTTAYYKVR